MQELQPELKALQTKYPGKDRESRMRMAEESQELYKNMVSIPMPAFFLFLFRCPFFGLSIKPLLELNF